MRDTRFWLFLIFLFSGIILGSLLGDLAQSIPYLEWLGYGKSFGFEEPFLLDLYVLKLTFGANISLNVAGILGIFGAVLLYKKVKV